MQPKNLHFKSESAFDNYQEPVENMLTNSENGLKELMTSVLNDLHWSEQKLLNHLPRLIRHAKTCVLIEALAELMEETKNHLKVLSFGYSNLEMKPIKNESMSVSEFLIETNEILKRYEKGNELDKALIAAIQKLKRFEIASYFSLSTLALKLEEQELAQIFQKNANIETEVWNMLQLVFKDLQSNLAEYEKERHLVKLL
jgi:ferritin-like metal-binding protein YciE